MEAVIEYFLQPQNGIMGIIIIVLGSLLVWQQRRMDGKDKQITDLQNQRVTDTNSYTEKYTEIAKEAVTAIKDSVSNTNLLQRSLDSLAQAFNTFVNGKK